MTANQEEIMRIVNASEDANPKDIEKMFYEVLNGALTYMRLEGTEKQIKWVHSIIKMMLSQMRNLYPCEYIQVIVKAKENHDCKWWIANKDNHLEDTFKPVTTDDEDEDIKLAQDLWNNEVDFF